jgi:hypothetical protein
MRNAWISQLLAAVLACACSEPSPGPSVGGNTNWLMRCDDAQACGDGLACLCGLCTRSCESDQQCEPFMGATCSKELARELTCGRAAAANVCLHGCAENTDCADDMACVQGACVTRPPPSSCSDHPDALVCSGFDSEDLNGFTITAPPDGTLATTQALRHAGAAALETRSQMRNDRTRLVREFPVQTSGTLYLRAWLFVEPGSVLFDLHTLTIGDVDQADWGVNFHMLEDVLAVGLPTRESSGEGLRVPVGSWFCMQAEVRLGDIDGAVRVWLDRQLAVSFADADTLPRRGARNMSVGLDRAVQSEPAALYIDELLLDRQPTECLK